MAWNHSWSQPDDEWTSAALPVRIANTGKTPALKMHGSLVVNLLGKNDEPDFAYVRGHPHYEVGVGGGTILPNLPQDLQFAALPKYDTTPDKPLAPTLVDDSIRQAMDTGRFYVVVHGEIFYDDVFGIQHWIRFCHYAHNIVAGVEEKSVANTCGPYNDIDKEK